MCLLARKFTHLREKFDAARNICRLCVKYLSTCANNSKTLWETLVSSSECVASLHEKIAALPQTFVSMRKKFTYLREKLFTLCETFVTLHEKFVTLCETFASLRESVGSSRKKFTSLREKYALNNILPPQAISHVAIRYVLKSGMPSPVQNKLKHSFRQKWRLLVKK